MHENREISCTSWSADQDRSAKAINRTADTNVQEKSDCAVLPGNQPNKEGQPRRRLGREGHRLRRTSVNLTCARHRVGNACPRDCPVCGKQQEKGSRNGSPLYSTTSASDFSVTASTHSSARRHRESMA